MPFLVVRQAGQPEYQVDDPELLSFTSATSLAFAGVLPFAAIVSSLTTALALAIILAFAPVLALFGICHCLQRDAGMSAGRARSICTNCEGSCQQASDGRTCDHCFGWSNHLSILSI